MDFRQRLEQSKMQLVGGFATSEPDEQVTSTHFAIERNKTPVCLELRLPDGSRKAVPYSYFTEISFDADRGIEILTTQKRIEISGRKLAQLFEYLVSYRVRYVASHSGYDSGEDELFVKEILIEEL